MKNTVKTLVLRLSLSGLLLLAGTPTMAAEQPTADQPKVERFKLSIRDAELIQHIDAQEKFMKLMDAPGVLSINVLNEVDFEVRDVAFYRFNDRQYQNFPRVFYDSIEQKLMDRFLRARRFSVHECFECKTTRVLLKEKQFSVLRQLDSNESLKEIGEKIGVDSFVLWEAYMYKGEPVLNLRIVSAANGQVRWSRQYQSELDYEFDWEIYSSLWGLQIARTATGVGDDVAISPILDFGIRTLSRSTIMDGIFYGYGIETFFNTMDRTQANLFGFSLNARAGIEIDGLLGFERKAYGNWLYYFSLGQAFVKNNPVMLMRTGIEIRVNRRNFIELGGVYLTETPFSVDPATGYADTASIGGLGYDVTIGFRF